MLRELLLSIGIDVNTKPLKDLDDTVDQVVNSLDKVDTGELDKLASMATGASNQMDKLADATKDVSTGMDDVADAAKDADSQVDKLADSVDGIPDVDSNGVKNVGDQADASSGKVSKLGGALRGLAAAAVAAGAIALAGNVAVGSIEAAAEAQAMSAQFEQVFKDLDGQAQETIDGLGDKFGMLPNRIKPAYTTMTSMFMGLGLSTEDAMGASERAVTAVADAAAFYDKSFEDANSALNSFIKGNYEGGESIGLFANETQLATWAADNLGVKWDDLGEADKQLARLQFAETMMESAGATGQAARESESYSNQMGNLKQAWQDFLAKAGAPILEHVVSALTWLSDTLSNIDPGPVGELISGLFDGLSNLGPVIETIKETITAIFTDTSEVGDLWEKLGVPPELAENIQNIADTYGGFIDTVKSAFDSFINEVILPLMPVFQESIGPAMEFVSGLFDGFANIIGIVGSVVSGLINNIIVPMFPVVKDVIEKAMNIVNPILRIAGDLFSGITSVIRFLVEEIVVPLLPIIPVVLKEIYKEIEPVLDGMAGFFEGLADAVGWVIDKVESLIDWLGKINIGETIGNAVEWVADKIPGYEVGLGRVPYDDMPALLHKDEAVLPKEEADALRNAGILKGDGTNPQLDFGGDGANSYANTAPVRATTSGGSIVQAPVNIVVQGGNTNEETAFNIREALEDFFDNLSISFSEPREG